MPGEKESWEVLEDTNAEHLRAEGSRLVDAPGLQREGMAGTQGLARFEITSGEIMKKADVIPIIKN